MLTRRGSQAFAWAVIGLAFMVAVPARAAGKAAAPPNWPSNPYWTSSPPPRGPGHKVKNFAELLKRSGSKENIGIKVLGCQDWKSGLLGTFEVGDEMHFATCIGTKDAPWAFNHKSGNGGGVNKATLIWMDETGQKALKTETLNGGCG